jgi:DNA processing protein
MDNITAALRLISITGLGPRRIINIKNHFKDITRVFDASIADLCQIPGIDSGLAKAIKSSDNQESIESQLKILRNSPFELITIFDDLYPVNLKRIYDPPIVLYYQGNFSENDTDAIAIVGTRKPTSYGKAIVGELVKGLVAQEITIISGFARGIDTIAHRATLDNEGRTIAVLGNGLDIIYPPENRELRTKIIQNGMYCSEFPLGTKPDGVNFPRRNRIISGLSLGVIVIEAGDKSGAILTAYYAVDQNREVFALPGRINDLKSRGTNRLIQNGAKLVTSVEDILEEIEPMRKYPKQPQQLKIEFEFEGEEKVVFESLSNEPINIDDLAAKLEKSPYEILPHLLSLELKGYIQQLAGKMFIRVR